MAEVGLDGSLRGGPCCTMCSSFPVSTQQVLVAPPAVTIKNVPNGTKPPLVEERWNDNGDGCTSCDY